LTLSPVFDVAVHPHRSRVRVAASGELDLSTCEVLRAQLDELWASGWTDVVVDLREVTFMDSTRRARPDRQPPAGSTRRAALSIIDGADPVSRVLQLSGVREMLAFTSEDNIG
jgi:anti-anti-sigma factor